MKSKSNTSLPLQIITGIGVVIYLVVMIIGFYQGSLSFMNINGISSSILFLLFGVGFVLSWKNKKIAGILLMIWNVGVWIYDFFIFNQSDYEPGMRSMMLSPVMVIGA